MGEECVWMCVCVCVCVWVCVFACLRVCRGDRQPMCEQDRICDKRHLAHLVSQHQALVGPVRGGRRLLHVEGGPQRLAHHQACLAS